MWAFAASFEMWSSAVWKPLLSNLHTYIGLEPSVQCHDSHIVAKDLTAIALLRSVGIRTANTIVQTLTMM